MNQVDIILRFTARANSLIDSIKDAGVKLEALNAQQRTANINNVLAQNKLGRAAKEVARIEELKLTQERTIAGVNHNISLEKTNIRTLEKQIQNHLDGSVKLTAAKLALVNKELLDSKQILKDEQLKITQLNAQTQILNNQMKTAKQTASERTKSANEFAKAEDKATKAVENQNKALAKSKEELKGIAEQANVHALQQARVVMDGVANGFARVTNEVVRVGNLFQSLRTRLLTSYGGDVQKTEETIAWIKAEAIRTPFQVTEIMGSYARLKMFAGSFKKDTKDMVTVVGDLATAFSQPLPRATQAVADAMNGMYVRLKNGFGITKQMIAAKAKEMTGETVINARGQITDMQAMNTALMAYIEDSSKGAMQRMSNTYKIAVSNLQDAQEALADSMAQVVLPQFRSITLSLTDLVMELNKAPLAYKNLAGGILYSGYAMSQIGQKLFAAAAAGGTLIQAYTAIAHAQALAASSGMKLIGVQSTLISLYTTISRVLPFTLGAAAIATVLGGISLAALETKIKTEEATQALIYLGAKKLHVTDEVKNLDKSVRDLKDSILEVNKTPLQIKTEGSTIPQSLSDNVANTKNVIDTLGTNSRPTALSNIKNTFEKSSVFNKILYDTGEAIYGAFVDLDKAAQRNYFKEKMDNQGFKLTKKPDFSGLNPTYLKEFEREEYAQTPLDITPFTSDENPLMKKSGMKFNNTPIYFSPDKKDPFKRTTLLEGTKNILTDLGENKEQFANYTRLNKLKTDGVELSKKDLETWTELNEKYKIGVELLEKAHTQIKKAPSEQFDSNTGRKKLLSQIEGILKDITVTTNIFQDWKTKAFDMLDKGKSSVVGKGITPQVKTLDNAGKMQTFVKDALKEADIYSKNQGANETGIAFNRLAMLRNMKTYQSDTKDTSKAATFSRNYKMDAGVEVEFDKLFEKEKKKLDVALAKVLSDFKGQKTALVTQADYENYTKQAEHHAKTFENLNNITIEYKESKNKLLFVDQTIIAQDAKAKIIKTDLEN